VTVKKLISRQWRPYVAHKIVDGLHFFVPKNVKAAGLCAAHCDLHIAAEEANRQLSAIARFNYEQAAP
jgi:hypothetical protein